MTTAVTFDDYEDHCDSDDGFCEICRDWTCIGGCEPDAEHYHCPVCECESIYGAEEALVNGLIEVVPEGEGDA